MASGKLFYLSIAAASSELVMKSKECFPPLRGAVEHPWGHGRRAEDQPFAPAHASAFALQNLRVRSTGGTEFFTRSATKFKGALAQKFLFVDGDRAMCGSYR